MRGRQIRCAGRKNDAGEGPPREGKMRCPSGPGENDARVQPPTHKKNARRIERHPARCTRHQGRGRCPSEFLSNTSSRRAIVCLYPVRMGLGSCRSVAKIIAFPNFQVREKFKTELVERPDRYVYCPIWTLSLADRVPR